MGKHKCICDFEFCHKDGGHATTRMPLDEVTYERWCACIFGVNSVRTRRKDERISAAHFPQGSLTADTNAKAGVGVKVRDGAIPSRTNADMERASKGALALSGRLAALAERHEDAILAGGRREQDLKAEIRGLRLQVLTLEAEVDDSKAEEKGRASENGAAKRNGIDHSLLVGKSAEACRSLCGLSSFESLTMLYEFLDAEGAAENMIFFDQREGGGRTSAGLMVEKRPKIFRGLNGLFFTLLVLRTAVPLVMASTIFGVHETTGGRAFTTWLNFLYRSLRPIVRLPSLDEVSEFAPRNFVKKGYGKCAIVLDATELEIPRCWQTDFNWVCYSAYKGRQTAKLLVGTTPGGAICYIGPAFPGRMTDAEVVKNSGILDLMREGGLCGRGLQVMADKGFNSISPLLIKEDLLYVAPPYKRQKESQFTDADMESQWEVANLRIHVERAIGAMKKWSIVNTKFDHKQLDQLEMCFHVVAALVNMIQEPFKSDK